MTQVLQALIDDYRAKRAAWELIWEADCDSAGDSAEWEVYEAAEMAMLGHHCNSLEEISLKATFILGSEAVIDSLANCYTDDGKPVVLVLLRSMLLTENGERPA